MVEPAELKFSNPKSQFLSGPNVPRTRAGLVEAVDAVDAFSQSSPFSGFVFSM